MRGLYAILWLGILLPMSVDGRLSLSFGNYSLRANYFALAATLLLFSVQWITAERNARSALRKLLQSNVSWAWSAMLVVGALGCIGSENLRRSILFWLWTAGTFFGLRLVVMDLLTRISWIPLSVIIYASAQSVVLWIDTSVCAITAQQGPFLGQVVVTSHICRPHGWYQEPNYLAAFLIFTLILCRQWLALSLRNRHWGWGFFGLILSGVFATTSRMGWVAASAVISVEAIQWVIAHRRRAWVIPVTAAGALTLTAALFALASQSYIAQSLLAFYQDASGLDRWLNQKAAWNVFAAHPWLGVGPGSSGAYLTEHWPDHPYVLDRIARGFDRGFLRNDPLSHSLYLELLSEWGLLGTIAFFGALWKLLRGLAPSTARLAWVGLPIVYLGAQSLPRFDLWVVLFVLSGPIAQRKNA